MASAAKGQGVAKGNVGRELKNASFVTDRTVFITFIIGAGVALLGFSLHLQKERIDWLRREQLGIDVGIWKRRSASSLEWRGFEMVAAQAKAELTMGSDDFAAPEDPDAPGSVFDAVTPTLPIEPPIVQSHADVRKQPNNVGDESGLPTTYCRVYVIGSASNVGMNFVLQMQPHARCEVHVFECGLRRPVLVREGNIVQSPFLEAHRPLTTFHEWCIGQQVSGMETTNLRPFKSLVDTMVELGHMHVDVLKLNMRGLEWQFIKTEILPLKSPPLQLEINLQTETARGDQVDQAIVKGKGYPQVNRFFWTLYNRGYFLTSKQINYADDPASAEFVLVKPH